MKNTYTQSLKDEETAKRVEEELKDAGRRVKREGRTITEYLLPKPKEGKQKHPHREHTSKRERDYGYARGLDE